MLQALRRLFFQAPASVEPMRKGAAASSYDSANTVGHRTSPTGTLQDAAKELTAGVRKEIVRRTQAEARNSGYLREIIADMEIYSVGDFIRVQSQSGNPEWSKWAESIFFEWCNRCEVTRRFSFPEVQTLVCRAIDRDGEAFIYKAQTPYGPLLQLIPSHRIGQGTSTDLKMRDGILMDDYGAPIAYNVLLDNGASKKVAAEHIIHVFEPENVDLVRNAPTVQHSLNDIRDEREMLSLEKQAAKGNADIVYKFRGKAGAFEVGSDFEINTDAQIDEGTDPTTLQEVMGSKVVAIKDGEDLEPYEFNRPTAAFTAFMKHVHRSAALGVLPYEFVADPSSVGGAAVRLVVSKADRVFGRRQRCMTERLLKPVWMFVIGDAIERGDIEAVSNWWKISAVPPRRVTVDAGREQREHRENVKAGLTSLRDHFEENGAEAIEELRSNGAIGKLIKEIAIEFGVPEQVIYGAWPQPKPEPAKPTPQEKQAAPPKQA